MAKTRIADEFDSIRKRMEELQRERGVAIGTISADEQFIGDLNAQQCDEVAKMYSCRRSPKSCGWHKSRYCEKLRRCCAGELSDSLEWQWRQIKKERNG
jgi:hypothetical protein